MKHSAENELNALASVILGVIGVSLLLIPSHLEMFIMRIPGWAILVLGIFACGTSISLQIASILQIPRDLMVLIRGAATFFLFLFTGLLIRAGCMIESIILFCVAVMQFILATSLKTRFAQYNLLKISFVLIGLSSGIYLALSNNQYTQINIVPYKISLAVLFLAGAIFGSIAIVFPTSKFSWIFSRLQVIPWLLWGAVFALSLSAEHLIAPASLILVILFEGLLPWDKLTIPENGILSHKVLLSASTLEMILLIFLSVILILVGHSFDTKPKLFVTIRETAFLFFIITSAMLSYVTFAIIITINGLMVELTRAEQDDSSQEPNSNLVIRGNRIERYIKPFIRIQDGIHTRLMAQGDQISILAQQLKNEKKRNAQLSLLMELSQQLENQLDQPVAAQLAVNSLERALGCSLASLYIHEPDDKEFMLLAAAGQQINLIPSGYRQNDSDGVLGRAVRQRKTQIINDLRTDPEYLLFDYEQNLSAVVIPLIFNGYVNGAIVLNSEKVNAFNNIDVGLAEAVAAELTRAWERSSYHQRLMNLVQAGSQLSAMVEPAATTKEVAAIAREILQARFAFVTIQLGQERNLIESASSGDAPRLLESLEKSGDSESLIQLAIHAVQPFRVRDARKYSSTAHLVIDNPSFRSMLAIPIRWHRMSIGTILAFGKQNEVFFNENDQSLAELLSIQAAGAFESTWLQQELRSSLRTTSLLYRLSNQIIQAENLENAASDIAQTAHKLAKSSNTGIVLFNVDGTIDTEVEINSAGIQSHGEHPIEIIRDAMDSGQLIYLSRGQSIMRACLPIQTPIRKYGALWMDIPEDQGHKHPAHPNDLQALVNQTAIALERSLLLVESRRQAIEIKAAFDTLESTYDQTLAALMSALDARDRETEGHSLRVSHLAAKLGETLNFTHQQLKVLERGSLLHDIGKIGIRDSILHKPGPLSEEEWKIMRLHPNIGAKIVEGIPFLQDTIPLIRHHQERWDGTGYPDGLKGEEIPILARMFSIVDAFDALTSSRPYRKKTMTTPEALQYLHEQTGILFDPKIVAVFERLVMESQMNPMMAE